MLFKMAGEKKPGQNGPGSQGRLDPLKGSMARRSQYLLRNCSLHLDDATLPVDKPEDGYRQGSSRSATAALQIKLVLFAGYAICIAET
jgi:hypothetical protein